MKMESVLQEDSEGYRLSQELEMLVSKWATIQFPHHLKILILLYFLCNGVNLSIMTWLLHLNSKVRTFNQIFTKFNRWYSLRCWRRTTWRNSLLPWRRRFCRFRRELLPYWRLRWRLFLSSWSILLGIRSFHRNHEQLHIRLVWIEYQGKIVTQFSSFRCSGTNEFANIVHWWISSLRIDIGGRIFTKILCKRKTVFQLCKRKWSLFSWRQSLFPSCKPEQYIFCR